MRGTPLHPKLAILSTPLPDLTFAQRVFLKSFLLMTEPLITVENQANLQLAPEPLIFAFNHNNFFEALLVPIYLIYCRKGRKINFVVDWMFGRIPVLGWILKQIDPIYVYGKKSTIPWLNHLRNQPAPSVEKQCLQHLANDSSIGIFPEGTRNPNPNSLLKGRKGIGHIAVESRAPVLPIGIDFPLRQIRGKIPKLGPIILRIGEPLYFQTEIEAYQRAISNPNLASGECRKLTRAITSLVTHKVMVELAKLSGKKYPFPPPSWTLARETVCINPNPIY